MFTKFTFLFSFFLAFSMISLGQTNSNINEATKDKEPTLVVHGFLIGGSFDVFYLDSRFNGYALNLDLGYFSRNGIGMFLKGRRLHKFSSSNHGYATDLGIAYRFRRTPIYLRSGFSAISFEVSYPGYFSSLGFHFGVGTIIRIDKHFGLRADLCSQKWIESSKKEFNVGAGIGIVFILFWEK